MAPSCHFCGEHVDTLKRQVSVMRKEIKNLRQMLDTATRTHRKHMLSIESAVSKVGGVWELEKSCPPPPLISPQAALEHGNIQTLPIGYIHSCFSEKNGTPRQPTVCGPSRAELRLQHSVFNNPDHALVGLEHFSHIWVIFLFHKNGHLSHKAKVKPPRLNGEKVGLYATRSPHRPNALGLTLAKLDKIVGDTIHLSDIDMIAGTPVLDIKPYIPDYDSPCSRKTIGLEPCQSNADPAALLPSEPVKPQLNEKGECQFDYSSNPLNPLAVLEEVKGYVSKSDLSQLNYDREQDSADLQVSERDRGPCYTEEAYSTIAGWIREPPVASLEVRFTPHAQTELAEFLPTSQPGPSDSDRPRFRFLRSSDEAAAAIRGVLSADPRSVYRRTRCKDKLFFFTLDTADVTCWFGSGFAEVLRVQHIQCPVDAT
ncbi:tRNA (adenine(37)-N6)-methyltransferase isoform X3 [Phyllopteryx taeniolatus]|uniref:tRNA (adenine(37)-N6)-methyltransferase isoform X3 n=1 Tax=Phyllopteryx taeniolatus TaxID=161469 RepID=UPI002AD3CAF2|nr:tRNA (adenine(37)-N6)-methyltransferase isoform X3 [Phyllopteryx taeniolatus]